MSARLKRLYGPAQPGTVTGVLATVTTDKRWTAKQVILANTTASAATVTLGLGGTTAALQIIPGVELAAHQVVVIDMTFVLESGETLNGLQGTSGAIAVTISGVEEDV